MKFFVDTAEISEIKELNELGMVDGHLKRSQIVDPPGKKFWPFYKGRDGCRTPIGWDESTNCGFTDGTPWLPINPLSKEKNVKSQMSNPQSIWILTQHLLGLRKRFSFLSKATLTWLDAPADGLYFMREADGVEWRVFINMGKKSLRSPSEGTCLVSKKVIQLDTVLQPNEVVVLSSSKSPTTSD